MVAPNDIPVAPTTKSKTIGHIMDAFKSITTLKYIHDVKKIELATILMGNYGNVIITNT